MPAEEPGENAKRNFGSRVILTTYPGQSTVNPIPIKWGAADPQERGPIIVSRQGTTISKRNAIGAHGGSYSVYFALANASGGMPFDYRPDYTNTEPPVVFRPQPAWSEPDAIVAMDPWGHNVPTLYKNLMTGPEGLDIRPTISITWAKLSLLEMEIAVREGRLKPDGKIVLNDKGEMQVTKVAVDPVWHLPGVAARFGVDEATLRRSLFEYTGGMYPELITRSDMKVFLPPIGGLTVYIFGDPAKLSDESSKTAVRVHDECNGSDVFMSDICTCRPYLMYGIEECAKMAQAGGTGVAIYFRKEGRALGEVTKYLVYNLRKRTGDVASQYFSSTERVAGVKDMRFQELMPDILLWLGIKKIDRMMSMSNMKYDAIVGAGIPIIERVELPDELIPEDSKVEIEAKINSGYFSARQIPIDLETVKGRGWTVPQASLASVTNIYEDLDH